MKREGISFTTRFEFATNIKCEQETRYRYIDLTVTSKDLDTCEAVWNECVEYLEKNSNHYVNVIGCPDPEEGEKQCSYYDSIEIEDAEAFEDLKEVYKEWKKLYR